MNSVELIVNGQKLTALRLESTIGRAHVSRCHTDSRFFSSEQFRLTPSGAGWIISPVVGSVNPTLVDGLPLTSPHPVIDGMTVTVRGATGLSIVLKCPIPDSLPAPAGAASLPPVTASLPPPTPPPPSSSPGTLFSGIASRMSSGFGSIGNWFRSGSGTATAIGAGALFAALFSGLSAASSSGSSGSEQTKVREGDSPYGRVILTIDGERVRRGDSAFGEVVMRFDGNRIRQGDSPFGRILATVDGDQVREGDSSFGRVIAKIDGNKVREGDSAFGRVIAITEGNTMSAAAAAVQLCLT